MDVFSTRQFQIVKLGLIASAMVTSIGANAGGNTTGGFFADAISTVIPAAAPMAQQLDRLNGQLGNPFDHAVAVGADALLPGTGQAMEAGYASRRSGAFNMSPNPKNQPATYRPAVQTSTPAQGYQPAAFNVPAVPSMTQWSGGFSVLARTEPYSGQYQSHGYYYPQVGYPPQSNHSQYGAYHVLGGQAQQPYYRQQQDNYGGYGNYQSRGAGHAHGVQQQANGYRTGSGWNMGCDPGPCSLAIDIVLSQSRLRSAR